MLGKHVTITLYLWVTLQYNSSEIITRLASMLDEADRTRLKLNLAFVFELNLNCIIC